MTRRTAPALAFLLAAGLLLGCSSPTSDADPTAARRNPPPAEAEPLGTGLPAFYSSIPDPASVATATVIAREPLTLPSLPTRSFRIAYSSRSVDGRPIAVTGLVLLPNGDPPPGGWPMVSWAHGSTGIGDRCAPSVDPTRMLPASSFLAAGIAFVATDYEGLGTVGRHPYLVGESEGRSVLDIALAASRVPEWSMSRNVAIWGHSQGGHAALFAMTMADRYDSDLDVRAIVAGAPASGFEDFANNGGLPLARPLSIFLALGLNGVDPERAPLSDALTPAGEELANRSTQSCGDELRAAAAALASDTELTVSPPTERWLEQLRMNDPQSITSTPRLPTLVIHGTADEIIPSENSELVHRNLCAIGQDAELWIVEGADHTTVVRMTFPTMVQWIRGRLGDGTTSPIVPPAPIRVERCR